MADITTTGNDASLRLGAHQTAIAVLLPPSSPHHQIISTLRSLYANGDKTWPWPHVNLLYPFVSPGDLPKAVSTIQSYLASRVSQHDTLKINLDTQGSWKHKDHATIYLGSSACQADPTNGLQGLRAELVTLFAGNDPTGAREEPYTPHMTVGNTSLNEELIADLSRKARTLIDNSRPNTDEPQGISWDIERLVVLQRSARGSVMKIVGEILLNGEVVESQRSEELDTRSGIVKPTISNPVYRFSPASSRYTPYSPPVDALPPVVTDLKILTYNILTDNIIPAAATTARYPLLVDAILSLSTASASILALQEVTDDFLAYLLAHPIIQSRYAFSTHSPTHDVLPSLRNCVTLSSIPFGGDSQRWEWVDLGKRHKGAVVIEVDIREEDSKQSQGEESDLRKKIVIANVHLTCGMSDTSIATKVSQLKIITSHLRNRKAQYSDITPQPSESWVLVGDFNFPTSHATATTAYTSKLINSETFQFLLSDHGTSTNGKGFIPDIWQDTYNLTHAFNEISDVEELKFDIPKGTPATVSFGWEGSVKGDSTAIGLGEFGATFNPFVNPLAAEQVKWGANPRPQRYDRILVASPSIDKTTLWLDTRRTGRFGLEGGSDHWGVFSDFRIRHQPQILSANSSTNRDYLKLDVRDKGTMTDELLERYLFDNGMTPSPNDYALREEAREMLAKILTNESRRRPENPENAHRPPFPQSHDGEIQAEEVNSIIRLDISSTIPEASTKPSIKMVIQPVGSYFMNIFTPASDLDVLCASNISPRVFWVLAKQRIRRHGRRMERIGKKDGVVRVLRYVEAQSGAMMELEYIPTTVHDFQDLELESGSTEKKDQDGNATGRPCRVRIDLQYCQVPERVLDSWHQLPLLLPTDPIFSLSVSSLKKINAYRDSAYLLQTIPNLKLFRLSFRALKLWAIRRGIFAARFGYLGGIHLVLLLSRVFKRVSPDQIMDLTAGEVLRLFFKDYAGFNYSEDIIADPDTGSTGYRRSTREPLVLTTPHSPMVNVAHTASKHTLKTLRDEILLANQRIGRNCGWDAVTGTSDGDAEREFLNAFGNFVKIDIHYWGRNIPRGRSLVGWIESRCVNLLVELNEKVPNIHARLWPGRFIDVSETYAAEELRGFYLIGLTNASATAQDPTAITPSVGPSQAALDQKRVAFNRFTDILRSFETYLQDEQKRYEVTESYISVNRVTRQTVGDNVRIDKHVWWDEEYETMGTANAPGEGSYNPNDDGGDGYDSLDEDSMSDEEEEEGSGFRRRVPGRGAGLQENADSNDGSENREPGKATLPFSTTRRQRSKQHQAEKATAVNPDTTLYGVKKPKLRPAHDIINRIKWDPEMDVDQYILGYEDRFLGVMETAVGKWIERRGGDETDEDWVPLHRVLYVRRKEDGVRVWDRDQRIDTIFGSGGSY